MISKLFDTITLKIRIRELTGLLIELKSELEKANKRSDELEKNVDYLITENTTLKQVNKRKYLKYEDKMKFLEQREKHLQTIEQMVKDGVDYRKVKNFIKGE